MIPMISRMANAIQALAESPIATYHASEHESTNTQMSAYRRTENNKQNRGYNPQHTKQETNNTHMCSFSPREPYTRRQSRNDLDNEYNN